MTNLFSCNAVVGSSSAQTPDFPCVADLLAHLDRLGLERALTWHVGARDFYTRWGNERLLAEIAATPGASGRVHALARGNLDHSGDAVAGGLRLGGDDGHLFADEGVEQRAFAHVGPAENGDKS